MLIGFGHLVGAWKAMCPETMVPELSSQLKIQMAQSGLISMKLTGAQI